MVVRGWVDSALAQGDERISPMCGAGGYRDGQGKVSAGDGDLEQWKAQRGKRGWRGARRGEMMSDVERKGGEGRVRVGAQGREGAGPHLDGGGSGGGGGCRRTLMLMLKVQRTPAEFSKMVLKA